MFAISEYLNNQLQNKETIIYNPILFDASCNGLQHLSALTRELDTAIKLNLISSNNSSEDIPQDFYTNALDIIQKVLDNSDNEKLKNINSVFKIFFTFKLNFNSIKTSTKYYANNNYKLFCSMC